MSIYTERERGGGEPSYVSVLFIHPCVCVDWEHTFGPKGLVSTKVCIWSSVMLLSWATMFDWHVVLPESRTNIVNDTCLKDVGLFLRILLSTPSFVVKRSQRTRLFSCGLNNYALLITMREIQFWNPIFANVSLQDSIMRHKFRCVYLIGGSRRTWETNQITPTYLRVHFQVQELKILSGTNVASLFHQISVVPTQENPSPKVCNPCLVTFLIMIPMFKWYVV